MNDFWFQVGNILKPLPHTNTSYNRTKPTKMQQRGSGGGAQSQQNQQNQNPNVGATESTSSAPATASTNDVKANLESVLEMSMDKRNVKSSNRGGKRKRINTVGVSQDLPANPSTSTVQ